MISILKQIIERDGVSIKVLNKAGASPVSSSNSVGFATLFSVSRKVFSDVIVAPGLTIAGTDSKHWEQFSVDSYRFNPMVIDGNDLNTFHRVNERISIDNLLNSTTFYATLIEESSH